MITAKEARSKSMSKEIAKTSAALVEIEKRINIAVEEGATSINYRWLGDQPNVMKALQGLGYTVKNESDQRENESWSTITW